jgi:16S rRNA (adenine1518-N6/adenine1519-N6)-dimethyltransferase
MSDAYPSPAELLRRHRLRPKKRWGQNFLQDRSILDRIVSVLEAAPADRIVELGAGLGHLTTRLSATGAEVVAVERDRDLIPVLEGLFQDTDRVRVLAADAKQVDLPALRGDGPRVLVAGNLPYHLTSPILFHLLEHRAHVDRAVLMMQKEVAERLAAEPGRKDYGILSVQTQMWASVRVAFDVSPRAFLPPPGVISSVVRLDFREAAFDDPGDPEVFRRVVRGAFAQRRKTLQNTLKSAKLIPAEDVPSLLEEVGLDPAARPETVTVEGYAALSRAVTARLGGRLTAADQ